MVSLFNMIMSNVNAYNRPAILDRKTIPLSLGYIREIHDIDSEKPVVVYIQDAHCNYSCQKSIEKIIEFYKNRYGVDMAAVEGGSGEYDFSIFTDIPDMEIREKVVDYFVREGRVTGVELFAIKNRGKITVKGLERPDLYEKNLAVYRESLSFKDKACEYIDTLKHYIGNLKRFIYSRLMKGFDDKKAAYSRKKIKFKDYISYLDKLTGENDISIGVFNNLEKLIMLMDKEGEIDFKKARIERENLMDMLMKRLSDYEVERLVQYSIDMRNDGVSQALFYDHIFKKARSCDIDTGAFEHLLRYKDYLERYDRLEKEVLFEEIYDAEKYIAKGISAGKNEEALYGLSDDLYILEKLFDASLTRRQYDYFDRKRDDIAASRYVDFIKDKALLYNMESNINKDVVALDEYCRRIENFYRYSFERDNAFMENIEKYSKGRRALFVVTGGFHTENVTRLLKEMGYPYVVVTPKLSNEVDNPYFSLLAGGLSPIETILSEYTSVIALRSVFSEMGIKSECSAMMYAVSVLRGYLEDGEYSLVLNMPLGMIRLSSEKPDGMEEIQSLGTVDGKEVYAIPVSVSDLGQGKERMITVPVEDISHELISYRAHESYDVMRKWAIDREKGFMSKRVGDVDGLDILSGLNEGNKQMVTGLLKKIPNIWIVGQEDEETVNREDVEHRFAEHQSFNLDHASHNGIYVTYRTGSAGVGGKNEMLGSLLHELGAYYARDPEFNEAIQVARDTALGALLESINEDLHLEQTDTDRIVRVTDGQSAVIGKRDLSSQAEDHNDQSTVDRYAEGLAGSIIETSKVIRPATGKVGIIVEVNQERMFPQTDEKSSESIMQEMKQLAKRGITSVTQHKVDMDLITITESRQATLDAVRECVDNGMRPVVFRLPEYDDRKVDAAASFRDSGLMFEDYYFEIDELNGIREQILQLMPENIQVAESGKLMTADPIIPCMTLDLQSLIGVEERADAGISPENIAVCDLHAISQIALLADAVNVSLWMPRESFDEEHYSQIVGAIMRLKATVERADEIEEIPDHIEQSWFLYDGSLALVLPRITQIDIEGDINKWYNAYKRVESAM